MLVNFIKGHSDGDEELSTFTSDPNKVLGLALSFSRVPQVVAVLNPSWMEMKAYSFFTEESG